MEINMKTKIVTAAAVLFCGASSLLQAQDMTTTNTTPSHWYNSNSSGLYQPYDVSLEAFGIGTVGEHTINHLSGDRIIRHGHLGAGAGLEFFFNRYIGIEAEGFSETTHNTFVNDAGGNVVFRLPIGQTGLAPYAFGGGGHEFYPVGNNNYADGGAGLEFRFTRNIGIFADARFVATEHTGTYGLGRLGLKFNF
jgi:hypothetical protein